MKHTNISHGWKSILPILVLVFLNYAAFAQVPTDTTKPATTTPPPPAPAPTDTATKPPAKPKHFAIYGGANSNTLSGSTAEYNANSGVGYHFGVFWEKGAFVYYQFGLRYNNAVYGFNSKATSKDTGDLKVQALDVPLTLGINFLSFAKICGLRAFISAVPSFTLGVSDNHFGIKKDNVNSFIFYGQAGIGANIAFAFLDIGYNYGTSSLLKNSVSSTHPGQAYLSLGIRF
jgi:hypothetical protein